MQKDEVKEVAGEIIGLEGNKLFRTIKDLTIKPGEVIAFYGEGDRYKYLSPVVYYFGVSAVSFYLLSLTGSIETARLITMVKQIFEQFGVRLSSEKIDYVFTNVFNQTAINVLFLPLTLIMTWLMFRRQNPSFKLTSWYALYVGSHVNLLMIPGILSYLVPDKNFYGAINGLSTFALLGYQVWATMQFFKLEFGKAILLFISLRILLFLLFIIELAFVVFLVYSFA